MSFLQRVRTGCLNLSIAQMSVKCDAAIAYIHADSCANDILGFGSVVKHSTAEPGFASSIHLTPTKITKK